WREAPGYHDAENKSGPRIEVGKPRPRRASPCIVSRFLDKRNAPSGWFRGGEFLDDAVCSRGEVPPADRHESQEPIQESLLAAALGQTFQSGTCASINYDSQPAHTCAGLAR